MGIISSVKGSYNIDFPIYRNTPGKFKNLIDTKKRFFIVGGTLYFLAESAIYDAYHELKKSKLYRHMPKQWANKCYKALNGGGKSIDDIIKRDTYYGHELWTDITDVAQEYISEQLMHLKVAVSNYVINHCETETKVKTEMLYSCMLYGMAVMFYEDFMRKNKEITGFDFSVAMKEYKCEETYTWWENATLTLTKDVRGKIVDDPAILRAHDAFFNVISRDNWFNEVSREGLRRNGNYEDVVAQLDKELEEDKKNADKEDIGIEKLKQKFKVNGK